MSIKAFFSQLCQSELYRLTYEGKVAGFRAKVFDRNSKSFSYFDFALATVTDKDLKSFLVKYKEQFSSLPLLQFKTSVVNADGSVTETTTLMTTEEKENNQLIKEFKTEDEAHTILRSIKQIYEVKEG